MNERNVEALTELLWEMNGSGGWPAGYREEARWLASRGVLAVDSLTDADLPGWNPAPRDVFVVALERIAKGEP